MRRREAAMNGLAFSILFSAALAAQTVQGLVVDAGTGAPLAGAYASVNNGKPLITRTDASGFFRLDGVTVPFQVSRSGYLERTYISPHQGEDLRVRLTPEAAISGTIEDEDGFPVEGAQVEALQYQEVNGDRILQVTRVGRSNDLGEYRISGLPADRYYLRATVGNL
jgi:hypothetical protein